MLQMVVSDFSFSHIHAVHVCYIDPVCAPQRESDIYPVPSLTYVLCSHPAKG